MLPHPLHTRATPPQDFHWTLHWSGHWPFVKWGNPGNSRCIFLALISNSRRGHYKTQCDRLQVGLDIVSPLGVSVAALKREKKCIAKTGSLASSPGAREFNEKPGRLPVFPGGLAALSTPVQIQSGSSYKRKVHEKRQKSVELLGLQVTPVLCQGWSGVLHLGEVLVRVLADL